MIESSLERLVRTNPDMEIWWDSSPYCIQAYDPNGLALEQFNDHPATLYTVEGFSNAAAGLEEYVGRRLAVARKRHEVWYSHLIFRSV